MVIGDSTGPTATTCKEAIPASLLPVAPLSFNRDPWSGQAPHISRTHHRRCNRASPDLLILIIPQSSARRRGLAHGRYFGTQVQGPFIVPAYWEQVRENPAFFPMCCAMSPGCRPRLAKLSAHCLWDYTVFDRCPHMGYHTRVSILCD